MTVCLSLLEGGRKTQRCKVYTKKEFVNRVSHARRNGKTSQATTRRPVNSLALLFRSDDGQINEVRIVTKFVMVISSNATNESASHTNARVCLRHQTPFGRSHLCCQFFKANTQGSQMKGLMKLSKQLFIFPPFNRTSTNVIQLVFS